MVRGIMRKNFLNCAEFPKRYETGFRTNFLVIFSVLSKTMRYVRFTYPPIFFDIPQKLRDRELFPYRPLCKSTSHLDNIYT